MTKEELLKSVSETLKSDTKSKYGFYVRVVPRDELAVCGSAEQIVERIYSETPEEFVPHVNGIRQRIEDKYRPNDYELTFDSQEWKDKFDDREIEYCREKADWCAKYGCD